MKLKLFIITNNRVNNQVTFDRMPEAIRKRVIFVVSKKESSSHKKLGRKVLVCPYQGKKGLAKVRDWLLEYCIKHHFKRVLFMDDDVVLYKKLPSGKIIQVKKPSSYMKALIWMDKALKIYAHAGFEMRYLSWDSKENHSFNKRVMGFLGYNVKLLKKLKVKFSTGLNTPTLSDLNMTLQLLKLGYPNIASLKWRVSLGKPNSPGGCSLYRTTRMNTKAAKHFALLHKGLVILKKRKSSVWSNFKGGENLSLIIRWKKAFNSSN